MKNTPYTVLMSVYIKEKAEYLKLSIQSMLDQTVPPDEFILVKDGPLTMELDAVVDYYNQKYPGLFTIISNETNLGLGPALAKGIVTSRNELIARMDSDDISEKTRCEKQLLAFEKNTDLEMVGSFEAEFIGEKDNVVSIHRVPETHSDIAKFMRRRCAILHPTVMYKKGAVIRSGNYHSVPLYEDYDLFARMVLEYNVRSYNIQENLYYIRTSEDFFKRRGGLKYAKTVLNFKWKQHKKGYMSLADFCISGLGQAFVCVLPNSLRKVIYTQCILIPAKEENIVFKATLISAVANIILNLVLIPIFGMNAAAFTTIIAEFIVFYIAFKESNKIVKLEGIKRNLITVFWGCVIIIVVCAALDRLIQNAIIRLFASVFVSGILYGVTLILMRNEIVLELISRVKRNIIKKRIE